MNLAKDKKVFVCFDTHIAPSFVEPLTIQKQSEHLLYFKEKTPYYAVEYKQFLFYAYSNNTAGNVLIVEKMWHLPFAKMIAKSRRIANVLFRKKSTEASYNTAFKKEVYR